MGKKGFTLIELVMVIVIIGILAAVAIPKFVDLSGQAKDGATKGALGALRSAMTIWYASNVAGGNAARFPTVSTEVTAAMADGAIPTNQSNTLATVVFTATDPAATSANGWVINTVSGKVFAGNNVSW